MRRLLPLLLTACAVAPEPTVCDDVCSELVSTCGYEAFPTFQSCQQGCGFWELEGADVEAYLGCVTAASCDTFDIVECEHEHGIEAE